MSDPDMYSRTNMFYTVFHSTMSHCQSVAWDIMCRAAEGVCVPGGGSFLDTVGQMIEDDMFERTDNGQIE